MPDDAVYMIHGGSSFADPTPVPVTDESDTYATLDEALTEWLRRRNDWTGRYPTWGDGAFDGVVSYGTEVEAIEVWGLVEAFRETGRDLTELYDFLEPADIGRAALAPTGASDHQQIVWALRALEGFEPEPVLPGMPVDPSRKPQGAERAATIRADFPELSDIRWNGAWFDLEAMGVEPEWVDELVAELELDGTIQWIDGEPFLVGLEALEAL